MSKLRALKDHPLIVVREARCRAAYTIVNPTLGIRESAFVQSLKLAEVLDVDDALTRRTPSSMVVLRRPRALLTCVARSKILGTCDPLFLPHFSVTLVSDRSYNLSSQPFFTSVIDIQHEFFVVDPDFKPSPDHAR